MSHSKVTTVTSAYLQIGIVSLAVLATSYVQAQSVGRLFSTPAERAELERQRLALYRPDLVRTPTQRQEPVIELPVFEEPELPDVIYRLGGTMLRSDGLYTVWLNGAPINQEDLPDNMELLQPFAQGRLRIRHPESGQNFEVKPGQVLNLTQGELFESYEFEEPQTVLPEVSGEAAGSITVSDPEADTLVPGASDPAAQ